MPRNYDDLSREELIRLLQARDRRDATRLGLVWEANEIERDRSLNADFVSLELDRSLSVGDGPWRNLVIEGDNFDALRFLRMGFAGRVQCVLIDPPYNTGNRDFIYNDRFVGKDDAWRHSMWLEYFYRRLRLARDLLTVRWDDARQRPALDRVFEVGLFRVWPF
jgi:adenine-specific DNA-methyltransferase